MWYSMLNPQVPTAPSLLTMPNVKKQQHRHLAMLSSISQSIPIKGNKSFKNPNFVNCTSKSHDSLPSNSNEGHVIIDLIKEKCPTIIPNTDVIESLNDQPLGEDHILANDICHNINMCNKPKPKSSKQKQRKKSRQNLRMEEINSMMQEEVSSGISDLSVQALEISLSPKPTDHTLGDFFPTHTSTLGLKHHVEVPVDNLQMLLTIKASPPTRKFSVSDSEDSFVLFAEPEHSHSPSNNSITCDSPCRTRRPSYCESEDSFIVFDRGDDSNLQDDSSFIESSESDEESSDSDESCNFDDEDCDEVDFHSAKNQKKVTFASTEKLCQVHPMIKWSFAYQAARKGPWEMYARDRSRFKDRTLKVERDIKHVFDPQHRDRIYRQRFQNL